MIKGADPEQRDGLALRVRAEKFPAGWNVQRKSIEEKTIIKQQSKRAKNMSGFCGILQDRGPVDEQLITKMREQMYHRGPDEESNYLEKEHLGLGFRHLGIIDPAAGGRPMTNEDGSLRLTFDGRIYNYESLRRQLVEKGHKMATQSDAEVILHLYEEKGSACLQDLRGMFAFALWDKKRRLLFGARDRFGIKPFYYFEKSGVLALPRS